MYNLLPFILGIVGYLLINFFIAPLLRALTLRQNMHEKLHLYANVWSPADKYSKSWRNKARDDFRTVAAKGLAEYENMNLWFYCIAKWALALMKIDLQEGSENFWAMETYAAQPDKEGRDAVEKRIRTSLRLPPI